MIPLFEHARQLNLTQTEKEILSYFEQNPSSAAYMNLQDLSRALYTSNATSRRPSGLRKTRLTVNSFGT